jgi:uncharacterized protein GlcG (DUF336 family)
MRAITLDQANIIIDGAFARAGELSLKPLSIIVLDAGGRVKAFQKQDGSALLRFEIAYQPVEKVARGRDLPQGET